MKKIFQIIKDKIDWIFIIIGSCLVSHNLLDYDVISGEGIQLSGRAYGKVNAWAYIYSSATQTGFAIGVCLIVFGVLLYKEKTRKQKLILEKQ